MAIADGTPAKTAVFVDAENHADLNVSALMLRLKRFDIVERHAYADQRNWRLNGLFENLRRYGFELHHAWSGCRLGDRKNTADSHMVQGIVRVLRRRTDIGIVVIVSGDAFFTDIARWVRERGIRVVVASALLRTSNDLRSIANEYLVLGKLERSIQRLHHLELTSGSVTFGFAVRKLNMAPSDLADLIRRGLVTQEYVARPGRGTRSEVHVNRRAYAVRTILSVTNGGG